MKRLHRITALILTSILLTACGGQGSVRAVKAKYPAQPGGEKVNSFVGSSQYEDWRREKLKKDQVSREVQGEMEDYYRDILPKLLISEREENTVCSPLNIYIALAMLAETTEGRAREQILTALQAKDIDTLRGRTRILWEASYADTPVLKSLLANSFWLREGTNYEKDTLRLLADQYYASSYSGEMGTEAMDAALRDWIGQNTGGLLTDHVKDLKTDSKTILVLVSAIYYKAAWDEAFLADATSEEIFHGAGGDTRVEMMHRTDQTSYFDGDGFKALSLPLADSGKMTFYLPDEGRAVTDLVTSPDFLEAAVRAEGSQKIRLATVNLTVPKFKAEKKTDLLDIMESLGMTDVLIPWQADFSPLTREGEGICVSQAEHTALVETNEDGVTGAAYTEIMLKETAALQQEEEEIDFILDRPFAFAITGGDGSLLFSGIVQKIG